MDGPCIAVVLHYHLSSFLAQLPPLPMRCFPSLPRNSLPVALRTTSHVSLRLATSASTFACHTAWPLPLAAFAALLVTLSHL